MAAIPTWFDESVYIANKLAQLASVDPKTAWNETTLKNAFAQNNMSAYDHFVNYGAKENVSPSADFNVSEYLAAKVALENSKLADGATPWTEQTMAKAITDAGMTVWSHYQQYGSSEGVNPSNAFDAAAYCAAKAVAMTANGEKQADGSAWTGDAVMKAIHNAGLSVLNHYEMYKGASASEVAATAAFAVADASKVTPTKQFDPYQPDKEIPAGKTFTLTAKVGDTFTGIDGGDDVVTGTFANLAGDKLVDGSSKDNDTINLTADGDVTAGQATITGFETLNVDYTGVFATTVALTDFDGLEKATINATNASYSGGLTVGAAGNATVVAGTGIKGAMTVNGVKAGTVNANGEVTSLTVAAGADALNATINAGAKTATVSVTGVASKADTATITLQDSAKVTLANFNDTGDAVTINAAAGKVVTFDGTAATASAKALTVKSSGAVTLKGDSAIFAGNTVTNGTTGLTVEVANQISAASTDFSKVAANTIVLDKGAAAAATGMKFANGQDVTVKGEIVSGATLTTNATTGGSLDLTIAAATAGDLVAADATLTSLNIIADAEKDAVTIGALTVSKAVISGDNKVDITTSATVDSLNASALTGDLKITSVAGGTKVAVVAGQGNNTVTFANTLTDISYAGGAKVDTVDFGTVAAAAQINADLGAGNDVATMDLGSTAYTGETHITFGAGDDTFNLKGSFATPNGGKLFIDMGEGTADTLKITDATDLSAGTATFSGVEVVELGNTLKLSADQFAKLNTVTVKGTSTLTVDESSTTSAVTIDASGIKGQTGVEFTANTLVLKGGAGNDTIIGSDFGDTITGSGGADTITGGKGADTISVTGGHNTLKYAAGDSTTTAMDTITGLTLNAGTADKIDIDSVGTLAVIASQAAGVASTGLTETKINDLLNSTNGTLNKFGGSTNTNAAILTTSDTKTVLVIDLNGDGTYTDAADVVIDITGATLTSFTADCFA